MYDFIKGFKELLYFLFKLFSVGFSTLFLVGIAFSLYKEANLYIAIAIALPFGIYYAFFWIGGMEKAENTKGILISGIIATLLYLTLTTDVYEYKQNEALTTLKGNVDYTYYKEQWENGAYSEKKFQEAKKQYLDYKNQKKTFLDEDSWIREKVAYLKTIRLDNTGKKSVKYKAELDNAKLYRDTHKELSRQSTLRLINSIHKIALILYKKAEEKQDKLFSKSFDLETLESLKNDAYKLDKEYLLNIRAVNKQKFKAMEAEALASAPSKLTVTMVILLLGLVIEIVLNALKFWEKLFTTGKDETVQISTMMTLLNKSLLIPELERLKVVHENGRSKGKVFAVYATMINIIVLYREQKKKNFSRYSDVTDADICNFRYLDVSAKRHIASAFMLLNNRTVSSLSFEDIKEIIKQNINA